MKPRRIAVVLFAAAGLMFLGSSPAQAWDNGTYLRTGDVFCTDQVQSQVGVRFHGHVVNGNGSPSIRISTSAGGPETVAWSQPNVGTGVGIDFNKYLNLAPGTFYRGCVTITRHTANTWGRSSIMGQGSSVADIGPHTARLSPGSSACGDWGLGPVRLTGTADAAVTWSVSAFDLDYGFVGTVFSTGGGSVDTSYVPGPDLSLLQMCVHNTSGQPVSVGYEMAAAQ
jgi:hypothetical protein